MRAFFEEAKMKTETTSGQSKAEKTSEPSLSANQKKLIDLMIPVVQDYYSNKHLSTEEAREVITANIKDLQGVMGKILGTVVNLENEKILSAMDEADQAFCRG